MVYGKDNSMPQEDKNELSNFCVCVSCLEMIYGKQNSMPQEDKTSCVAFVCVNRLEIGLADSK